MEHAQVVVSLSPLTAMSSATAQKRAAFAVLQFLEDSLKNGSIKEDDKEGIEVASASPPPRVVVVRES